jgi:flagellar P-ring protein precursor FlgI
MKKALIILMLLAAMGLCAPAALAVKIADITHMGGQRTNVLTGLGLVVGLKGSGDGGGFQATIRPLAAMLAKFQDHVDVTELTNAANVAVVNVFATIPSTGARNGDKIDCYVTSCGAATSLKGGRLFITPMTDPAAKYIWALSEGPVDIQDASAPTSGIVKQGCVMEANIEQKYVSDTGQFTLVIENPVASWTAANRIAQIINDAEGAAGETLAVAKDPKTVEVTIPKFEREHPDGFISRVQRLPVPAIMLANEARVLITAKSKSIIMTGDVEISPVVISHNGLTITTVAPPPRGPQVTNHNAVAIDTTNEGGAKLQDLLNALDQLRVPADDRIVIIEELYDTGKLHAKLVIEGQP